MSRLLRGWEFTSAALAGIAAGFFMRPNFYGDAVAEIVTVLGFIMAALVPAMALAASSIRSANFSVKHIRTLSVALNQQIRVFGGLFFYALTACVICVGGKLLHWRMLNISLLRRSLDLSHLLPIILTFLFVLLIMRAFSFVSGILSVLRLATQAAEDEARSRDATSDLKSISDLESYQLPATYGAQIDLKH